MRVDDAAASEPLWMLIGASASSWGGIRLPLPLAPFGMPGCDLLVSPDLTQPIGFTNASGRAWVTLPIPGEPGFLGAAFHLQAAVRNPTANALGLLWTNGGRGVIGMRP